MPSPQCGMNDREGIARSPDAIPVYGGDTMNPGRMSPAAALPLAETGKALFRRVPRNNTL